MFCTIIELKISTRRYVLLKLLKILLFNNNFFDNVITTTNYINFIFAGNSAMLFHSPAPTAHMHNGIELKEIDYSNCKEKASKEMFFQLLLQMPKDKHSLGKYFLILV